MSTQYDRSVSLLEKADSFSHVRREIRCGRSLLSKAAQGNAAHNVPTLEKGPFDPFENPSAVPAAGNQNEFSHSDASTPY